MVGRRSRKRARCWLMSWRGFEPGTRWDRAARRTGDPPPRGRRRKTPTCLAAHAKRFPSFDLAILCRLLTPRGDAHACRWPFCGLIGAALVVDGRVSSEVTQRDPPHHWKDFRGSRYPTSLLVWSLASTGGRRFNSRGHRVWRRCLASMRPSSPSGCRAPRRQGLDSQGVRIVSTINANSRMC